MNIPEFLSHLHNLNVELSVSGSDLRCRVPSSVATPELQAELTSRKAEIIAFLNNAKMVAGPESPPLRSVTRQDNLFPLSFRQEGLWSMEQSMSGDPRYSPFAKARLIGGHNICEPMRLKGPLNVEALARTFQELARRQEVFRMTFTAEQGQPMQQVDPTLTVSLPLVDLQNLPEEAREKEWGRLGQEDSLARFNLVRGPAIRVTLLRLGAEDHILLLTMHHIISDCGTSKILNEEMTALYRAFSRNEPSALTALPFKYTDFATWQREWLQGPGLEKILAYWEAHWKGMPETLNLPLDRPRPPIPTFRGASEIVEIAADLSAALKALSQREEVTLFMMLLAIFDVLLYRYTGQDDIVVGSPISGRILPETDRIIGFFAHPLVLRTNLGENPTFRELLKRVREVTLGAYAYQVPYEALVEKLWPGRDLICNPLLRAVLSFQHVSLEELPPLADLTRTAVDFERNVAVADVALQLFETPQGISGFLGYNSDIFESRSIVQMVKHFESLLEGVVRNADCRIADLPLTTEIRANPPNVEKIRQEA